MEHLLSEVAGVSVAALAERYGTPFFAYDRAVIEQRIADLAGFETVRFAQKACSNIAILALMRSHGIVVDAVSAGEIYRALRAGYSPAGHPPGIVYTADVFDDDALALIAEHGVPVNCGSPDMLEQLADAAPEVPVTLRINPGFGHGHSRKTNTGGPLSKHGIWHEQLEDCLARGKALGLNISGLHLHIGSGTDFEHLATVCDAMVGFARRMGGQLETISAGGGLPIPYHRTDSRIDLNAYRELWARAQRAIEDIIGHPVALEIEPGRYLVAESGMLAARIRAVKEQANNTFYLVDAGFETLVRPAMYGSVHEISVVRTDGSVPAREVDAVVGGPLCESGDVFTQEEGGVVVTRRLPEARVGDLLVIHDAGAYGASMSSNYNTRPLAAELLVANGQADVIRERQTFDHILQFERIPAALQA
jgi:diaminopimelate decarboxylase